MHTNILYSFRRCPYAMRARLAILFAGVKVTLREIELKNKPQAMLDASPKGTVPVFVKLEENTPILVIDESLDIMHWALNQNDSSNILRKGDGQRVINMDSLIAQNDAEFKLWLDKYKYCDRFPEQPQEYYQEQGEKFLSRLEALLENNVFLYSKQPCLADIAIFPFVRQFSLVDKAWIESQEFPYLKKWLAYWQSSKEFEIAMEKFEPWLMNNKEYLFGK
ncbi:glutathione S-transferase [Shewanella sp. 202IG2-18]|uniref:glutathione S-transferase n=1 Tax=Parashewanella hymeniacidonis TaxID=2807618 RepID=UPI00196208CF|nr:glutathione S-transferase [Parashewanella hymeniacidonis]MBM7070859.1 glutathione S-transferase [Parashewanella hymeniacidonis]